MSTRFAAITTGNTRPLLDVLGPHCDGISARVNAVMPEAFRVSADAVLVSDRLDAIAERNVMRRRIRYPQLFSRPAVVSAYRAIYRGRARLGFSHIHRQLARDTDRVVLVFNGYMAPNALLALAAETLSMPRLFLENGFYPRTMQADPAGINALSTLPRDAAFYDGLSEEDLGESWPDSFEMRPSKLKDRNGASASDDLPSSYVFVPFQVPSDMQILALSPWIDDMKAMHGEVAALADAFPERHFVIKEHPSFPLSVQDAVSPHPRIHFANSGKTRDLIAGAEAVLTVNSTVGLEALTLGRKVITLGEAHYNIDGLVQHATDREALHAAFARLDEWQPDDDRRRRFIRFVFNRYLVALNRTAPGSEALDILRDRAAGRDTYCRLVGCAPAALGRQ